MTLPPEELCALVCPENIRPHPLDGSCPTCRGFVLQMRNLIEKTAKAKKLMPCGHPGACLVESSDDYFIEGKPGTYAVGKEDTMKCAWCEDIHQRNEK